MKSRVKKMGIIAVALAAVVGLSACGEIEVDSPNGQGDCGGNPVTLVTSENASGDTLTIDYTGPNTVGLFYSNGFYWNDSSALDPSLSGDYMLVQGSNVDLLWLDTSAPGWVVTGSGASWHYSFTGSIQTLLNSQTFITMPASNLAVAPSVISVDCDATNRSRTLAATVPGFVANIVPGFSFAVAQPLTPNTLAMDPFEVVTSHTTSTGATATLRYSSAGLEGFGSFTPGTPGSPLYVFQAFPGLATDTLHDLYLHALLHHNSGGMTITSTNPDGSFNVTIDDGSGGLLADGDYLVFLMIPNVANNAFRLVFAEFVYDHDGGGVIFKNPFAHLAQTGTPSELPVAAGLTAGGLTVVGGALLFIARRRRRHVG